MFKIYLRKYSNLKKKNRKIGRITKNWRCLCELYKRRVSFLLRCKNIKETIKNVYPLKKRYHLIRLCKTRKIIVSVREQNQVVEMYCKINY